MNAWAVLVALVVSLAGTGLMRRLAIATGLLDRPNDRSSHTTATPRGGGVAIVAGVAAGAIATAIATGGSWLPMLAWLGTGMLVAAVGFLDDRRGLPAVVRLAVHGAAAFALVAVLGLQPVPWPGGPVDLGWPGLALAWLAVVWSINLCNFMDGTDGIAAAQALFVFGGAAAIGAWAATSPASVSLLLVFAAASAGFLAWNWPPARIFMGDAGSGFLGFLIAAAALLTASTSGLSIWTWLALNAAFLADATVTVVVRAAHRERVHQAHRSHVYQSLARRWGSHRRVLLAYAAVNVLWLLPLAALTVAIPRQAVWFAAIAVVPLCVAAFLLGGGRGRESTRRNH